MELQQRQLVAERTEEERETDTVLQLSLRDEARLGYLQDY